MRPSLSRDQVRAVDSRAIQEFGLPGIVLMENAARGTADLLLRLGIQGPVVICAGKGNNAGDGFAIARHLENHDVSVHVLLLADPDDLQGDALTNFRVLQTAGTPLSVVDPTQVTQTLSSAFAGADWIVDAFLGTGTRGAVRAPLDRAIEAINAATARVLAVDLPSGMDCDTGDVLGVAVQADHTATFVARKLGFDIPGTGRLTGTVHVIDIGVPRKLLETHDDASSAGGA